MGFKYTLPEEGINEQPVIPKIRQKTILKFFIHTPLFDKISNSLL